MEIATHVYSLFMGILKIIHPKSMEGQRIEVILGIGSNKDL